MYEEDTQCVYCLDPSIAFAGSVTTASGRLCNEHRQSHERYERLFARFLPDPGRQPRWRYFEHNEWLYCWTTERMPDGKFAAFIYKPEGDGLRLVKEVRYAKRTTAKAKALAWQTKAKQRASGRLPASALK